MVRRNDRLKKLQSSYLFFEIARRKEAFLKNNPSASLINLGIGDTTLPLPKVIAESMSRAAENLSSSAGYSGYGPATGRADLRQKISEVIYGSSINPDEIFISDGSKCDIGRLQLLFGPNVRIAVQDPAYPAYVDGSLLQGVSEILYMQCTPENDFFPHLDFTKSPDIIYFCSPNNPTGKAATRSQLERLVTYAIDNQAIIVFDSAYSGYIQDPDIPRSIFEIPQAKNCAIETGSFSKLAGFTGVRLGWTVVPKELLYSDLKPLHQDWIRVFSTIFNGASNIAQEGGLSVLSDEGLKEIKKLVKNYMNGAAKLFNALSSQGSEVYGGINCPYLWVRYPLEKSWDMFQILLDECGIISTPGAGFGPSGEGFIRFSAFAPPEAIDRAIHTLSNLQLRQLVNSD